MCIYSLYMHRTLEQREKIIRDTYILIKLIPELKLVETGSAIFWELVHYVCIKLFDLEECTDIKLRLIIMLDTSVVMRRAR